MIEQQIRTYLEHRLSPPRLRHSEATGRLAADLCITFNLPPEKGMLAGLSHDISRELSRSEMERTASVLFTPEEWELENWVLLHGKAGAVTVSQNFGIQDNDILEAIALHTTGAVGMGGLAKIVYIADYVEPNRNHGVKGFVDELKGCTLDAAFLRVVELKVAYCRSVGKKTAPPTVGLLSLLGQKR